MPSHGANPHLLLKELKLNDINQITDFSVNTNPLGVPPAIDEAWESWKDAAFTYPSVKAEKLTETIASKIAVGKEGVLVTNGAAEAFFLIASLFANKKVAIVEPTFIEYRQACEAYQCEIVSVPVEECSWQWRLEELIRIIPYVEAVWICHPNNPTGVMYPKDQWDIVMRTAKTFGTRVIIDEAFVDFVAGPPNFLSYIDNDYPIIIVRSLTKMFHIAGIRLGYVVASSQLIKHLSERQPPWSVNGVAQEIGLLCLSEEPFVRQTVSFIERERKWLTEQLLSLNLAVSPSVANYFLCSIPPQWSSRPWLTYLAKERLIVRHTENFYGLEGRYVRLAVKTRDENKKLLQAIQKGFAMYDDFC